LVDNIDDVIYANDGIVTKNPNVMYIGGFYYEKGDAKTTTEKVVNAELEQIDRSDMLVVNLIGHAAIGSVAEIMYAATKGKRMEIFMKDEGNSFEVVGEYWFPLLTLKKMHANFNIHKITDENEIIDYILNIKEKE
jgi:nucleoside 2-deoxyribosyltransferase